MRIASFDIGKKNFAFYIEETDTDVLKQLPKPDLRFRYKNDGSTTELFEPILKEMWKNGTCILFRNYDLTQNTVPGSYLDPETYYNMFDVLDRYKTYWDTCDVFLIELQMSFGKRHNTMALKLGQHCYSYFVYRYNRFKTVIEFPSYHKTQLLGAPKIRRIAKKGKKGKPGKISYKAMDKVKRKKWSIDQARIILEDREDDDTLEVLNSSKKKDDLADVLCQLQAFKCMTFLSPP